MQETKKQLKASDILRQAAKNPEIYQIHGSMHDKENGYCALGIIFKTLIGDVIDDKWPYSEEALPLWNEYYRIVPRDMQHLVMALNDICDFSFEQVANWLEQRGY
jgi:hypothetical protein